MDKHKILFMDDNAKFREARSAYLKNAGYEVLEVSTVEDAEKVLQSGRVHLAILDVRMVDQDEGNRDGLWLAQKPAYRTIPKIIQTGHPNQKVVDVVDVLRPAPDRLPPAVDFIIDKTAGKDALIEAVNNACEKFVRINLRLPIRLEPLSWHYLADLIALEIDKDHIPDRAYELEKLFRRLFYDSSHVIITRLLVQREMSVLLAVSAFSVGGQENQFIVVCSRIIQEEGENEIQSVPQVIGEADTVEFRAEETEHFVATPYKFTKGGLEDITTFGEFYRTESTYKFVEAALKRLFSNPFIKYRKELPAEENKLLDEFLLERLIPNNKTASQQKLEHRLKDLWKKVLLAALIEDEQLEQQVFDLVKPLAAGLLAPDSAIQSDTTPGRLDGDTILVSRQVEHQPKTWFIDFSQAKQGLLFSDLVSLEMTIKFDLLSILDLLARVEMEKRSMMEAFGLNVEGFNTGVLELEAEVQKARQTVVYIRNRALTMIPDRNAYLRKLLFYTLGRLADYDCNMQYTRYQLMPYLHSFMSTVILYKVLVHPSLSKLIPELNFSNQAQLPTSVTETSLPTPHNLRIDEDRKEVWVEGKLVELTPAEYELLLVLYRRANQLRTRPEISRELYPEEGEKMINMVTTTVSRLRKKIEPDPGQPKYIISIREKGYKLDLGHNLIPG